MKQIDTNVTKIKTAKFKLGKAVKNGVTYHTLYVPEYLSADKKARRLYFRTRADAERKRVALIAATRTEAREAVLSNAQLVDARRAFERLAEAGLSISLDHAIEVALPLLRVSGSRITVRQLLAEFAEIKAPSWRPHTAANFRQASAMMNEALGDTLLTELTSPILGAWLNSYERPAYIAGMIRTLRPAFSYAVRQGMLPESPFSKLEPVRVPARAEIDIFTPAEARRLMETATEECRAAFALLLFAGIRPVELTKLTWGAIRDGYVHLTPSVAKTAQVRNVEMEPTLAAWLATCGTHRPDEKVCPANWKRKSQAIKREAGLSGRQDTARHSYASYHLATYRDKAALLENMGHSANSAILMRHYRAAATPTDAAQYWAILP